MTYLYKTKRILGGFRTNQSSLSKYGWVFIYSRCLQRATFRKTASRGEHVKLYSGKSYLFFLHKKVIQGDQVIHGY